jgi:hypothetical protein
MASTVFFSFHYNEDWSRMWNIRQSNQFKNNFEDSGTFRSRDRWESVRLRSDRAIKDWIDEGLKYSGVTVVLISGDTWKRDWVRYEISESERQGMGMLGIRVHNMKDLNRNYGVSGPNPFSYADIYKSYLVYDWITDDGYNNLSSWVSQAADARR